MDGEEGSYLHGLVGASKHNGISVEFHELIKRSK